MLVLEQQSQEQLVRNAFLFADRAHASIEHIRTFSKLPYIVHPIETAEILMKVVGVTPEMIAAGYLHDVVEDTPFTIEQIQQELGDEVAELVSMLTNPARTPEHGSRAVRTQINKNHNAKASPKAKTIRLADVISNLSSLHEAPVKFSQRYVLKTESLLEVLTEGDKELWARAYLLIQNLKKELFK